MGGISQVTLAHDSAVLVGIGTAEARSVCLIGFFLCLSSVRAAVTILTSSVLPAAVAEACEPVNSLALCLPSHPAKHHVDDRLVYRPIKHSISPFLRVRSSSKWRIGPGKASRVGTW